MSSISERTLYRMLELKTKPTVETVIKLYVGLLGVEVERDILESCPDVVKKYILEKGTRDLEGRRKNKINFLKLIQDEPLAGELFILAQTSELNRSSISIKYGEFGLDVLEKLVTSGVLIEVSKSTIKVSNQPIEMSPEVIRELSFNLMRKYLDFENTEKFKNTITFYAEGISEDCYQQWNQIDTEAYQKKLALLKDKKNLGPIPVFTFSGTDTLMSKGRK